MSDRIRAAVEDSDAHLVDLTVLSPRNTRADGCTFAYHAADFFHPNSAATAKWAQLFADAGPESRRGPAPVVGDAPVGHALGAGGAIRYDDGGPVARRQVRKQPGAGMPPLGHNVGC